MAIHARLRALVEAPWFDRFIIILVLSNALILGLDTGDLAGTALGHWLSALDRIIIGVFCGEIAMKIYVYRGSFFRDYWRIFDFVIVAISLVPAASTFSILRSLRVLRVLRLITFVPSMRRVIEGLILSIPGIGSIALLLLLILYVGAVMGVRLFGASDPDLFGNMGVALFSLFQVMTLENWSIGVVKPVMETHWWAWIFFITFMLATSFTIVNLFVGIIVEAMQREYELDADEDREAIKKGVAQLLQEMHALRQQVDGLKSGKIDPKA